MKLCHGGLSYSDKGQACAQKHLELTLAVSWMLGSHPIFQECQNIAFLLDYFLAALLLITLSWNSTFILQHIKIITTGWVSTVNRLKEVSQCASCGCVHWLPEVCWQLGLTCWAFSSQQMAGLSTGSPALPCHVQPAQFGLLGAHMRLIWEPFMGSEQCLVQFWEHTLSC